MNTFVSFATSLFLTSALLAAPGGGGNPPGGGGNQPDAPGGGSSGTFTYDTFLTDAETADGTLVYDGVWTGFVADTAALVAPSTVTVLVAYALAANESPQALTLTYDGATLPTTNATTFLGRTLTASYTPTAGAVCRVEAKPLVDWLAANADTVTQPASYASADLRTWLADTDNLTAYLYAASLADDASFVALDVSGSSFIFHAQDAATDGVVTATLQFCTDLADADWQDVAADDIVDEVFAPGTSTAFARIRYAIPW